jgi:hypothetical protein
MMIVVHVRRLQSARGTNAIDRVWDAFMWLEPYIAASFLFIAGYSLVLSRTRGEAGWLGHVARRALGLYALAVVLFVPQYGLEWPDILASPGILSAIALAVLGVAAALASARPDAVLGLLGLGVLAITFVLDRTGATVPGLNAGPGGAFPLVSFATAGAVVARLRNRHADRALVGSMAIAAVTLVLALVTREPWITTRASLYHEHAGQLALGELLNPSGQLRPNHFWNHSAVGALGLLLPLAATLWVSLRVPRELWRRAGALLVLGRHALSVYVAHLGLLGMADLAGWAPRSGIGTALWVALVALAGLMLALGLDRLRARAASPDTRPADRAEADTGGARSSRPRT